MALKVLPPPKRDVGLRSLKLRLCAQLKLNLLLLLFLNLRRRDAQ
jgi:hypothetical protein